MAMILLVVYLGDNPRLFRRYRHQTVALDRPSPHESALVAHLEQLLNARVHRVVVQRLDLVNDTRRWKPATRWQRGPLARL